MYTPNALAHSYFSDPELQLSVHDGRDLVSFILREYAALIGTGINIILCDDDPYSDHDAMRQDFLQNRTLKVYTGGTSSPLLSDAHNIMFRAVHDAHHIMAGADFTLEGEIKAFQYIALLVRNNALRKLFFSEIVLQAGTFYATGTFPEQRIVDSPLMSQFLTRG